jgi:undecaprenol kinase
VLVGFVAHIALRKRFMKDYPFSKRLGFALGGLREGWRRERSFRTQTRIGVFVTLALIVVRPAALWCAVVGLVIVMVLATELVNSALEALVDHLHPETHPEIRIIKDMAAASVLLVSSGAVVVALCLLATML